MNVDMNDDMKRACGKKITMQTIKIGFLSWCF
jgi:hypothetical protein